MWITPLGLVVERVDEVMVIVLAAWSRSEPDVPVTLVMSCQDVRAGDELAEDRVAGRGGEPGLAGGDEELRVVGVGPARVGQRELAVAVEDQLRDDLVGIGCGEDLAGAVAVERARPGRCSRSVRESVWRSGGTCCRRRRNSPGPWSLRCWGRSPSEPPGVNWLKGTVPVTRLSIFETEFGVSPGRAGTSSCPEKDGSLPPAGGVGDADGQELARVDGRRRRRRSGCRSTRCRSGDRCCPVGPVQRDLIARRRFEVTLGIGASEAVISDRPSSGSTRSRRRPSTGPRALPESADASLPVRSTSGTSDHRFLPPIRGEPPRSTAVP